MYPGEVPIPLANISSPIEAPLTPAWPHLTRQEPILQGKVADPSMQTIPPPGYPCIDPHHNFAAMPHTPGDAGRPKVPRK